MPAAALRLRVLPCGRLILSYVLAPAVADRQSKPRIFSAAGAGAGTFMAWLRYLDGNPG